MFKSGVPGLARLEGVSSKERERRMLWVMMVIGLFVAGAIFYAVWKLVSSLKDEGP
ncbi:MAG: hypothetical protein HQ503_08750 [Rhodospirillales bacterium]|nr:hypothetical protein [Rhodospirillales bacterium]